MVVLIIFPVILQTDINVIMLPIGGQGALYDTYYDRSYKNHELHVQTQYVISFYVSDSKYTSCTCYKYCM